MVASDVHALQHRLIRRAAILLVLIASAAAVSACSGDTDPATSVTDTSAQLNAHGVADNGPAYYYFDYGRDTSYGTRTPTRNVPAGAQSSIAELVNGLSPSTTYHFRICGNDQGKAVICMHDQSFTTTAGSGSGSIFSDGFESGDFSAWSQVQTAADGTAAVQSAIAHTGSLAAQLSESATSGSKAYVRKTFSAARSDLTASGDFLVRAQGASGGNVPLFRFLDPAAARVVSVYRLNGTSGKIGLGYGGANLTTSGSLPLNSWGTVSLHAITAGTGSTVEVRLNGTLVYRTTTASLGTAGISTVQLGNDTAAQAFTLVADTIDVQSGAPATPAPPANSSPPVISGTPQTGQTLNASSGNWAGTQPISYAYQWRRCDANGLNCAPIPGPSSSAYAATDADVGSTLSVTVTATNTDGSTAANSDPTAVVQAASVPPSNTTPPTISGTAQAGQTLNAVAGSWSGSQPISYAYAWQRCDAGGAGCNPISGASGSAYAATGADVGSTLRVIVTATNSAGSAPATSSATAVVQPGSTQAGVVALWHMDETSGSVMYDGVGSHDGALHSVQLGQPGFSGTAYGFSGSGYVSVPTASDLNAGSQNLTVTLHLKTTNAPATPDWDLIRKGLYTTPGGEFKMEYQPSGQPSCGFNGSSGYSELMAGPAVNDNQWHTVQCIKTSSAIKVVVDGQAFSKSATIGTISNTDSVVVGARPGSEFFKGSLDEASLQIG